MAWNFSQQIHALTGFDGDLNSASEAEDATYRELTAQWLTDAAKEVTGVLPSELKVECSTITNLYIGNTDTVMDLDASGEVFYVTRENADSGYFIPCRKIGPAYAGLTSDSTSLHYATATDPVYWLESDSGGDPKLHVFPTPTSLQPAKVYHVSYPSIDYDATAIVNFPDEAEHLVVLRAAITAAEYMMAIEEDIEVFGPIIANLRKEYQDGISILASSSVPKQSQKLGDIAIPK